jgi:alkanesulfonate monooxygenase SsuD/methylene tetrahydromethanopterin reductase-like flavin-dependent oxidoreductase (luciferase family)
VPLLIGGNTEAAVRRTVEFGIGWTAGGAPPQMVAPFVQRVRAAWRDAGRDGSPRIVALNYFSLGDTEERSRAYLLDYYGFLGPQTAEMIAGGAHRSPQAITDVVAQFAEIGVDELILDPTVGDPEQVDLLARAALS